MLTIELHLKVYLKTPPQKGYLKMFSILVAILGKANRPLSNIKILIILR